MKTSSSSAAGELAALDRALKRSVNDGAVDYRQLAADADSPRRSRRLAKPATFADDRARLVYYINAYNALVLQGVIEGLSATNWLRRKQFFDLRKWTVAGASVTLNDIEHRILRKLGEPRIHFAINCASASCPKLRAEAYTAKRLDAQLDDAARGFMNDPTRNRFDATKRVAHLSEIFKWFEEDFLAAAPSIAAFVARFVTDTPIARALTGGEFRIEWIDYDWRLNGTPP